MRGGIYATRKGNRQAKVGGLKRWRNFQRGTDQIMVTMFRVGMDGIVDKIGY